MKRFSLPFALAFVAFLAAGADVHEARAETCFTAGSQVDGLNRICFYRCPSGGASITVSAASICPISIDR